MEVKFKLRIKVTFGSCSHSPLCYQLRGTGSPLPMIVIWSPRMLPKPQTGTGYDTDQVLFTAFKLSLVLSSPNTAEMRQSRTKQDGVLPAVSLNALQGGEEAGAAP